MLRAMAAGKHVHHSIDYIEITVKNVKKAKAFYAEAFGWKFNDYGDDYAGIVGVGREAGGLAKGKPSKGGPLVVLYSKNLDKTLAAEKKAGGKIKDEPYGFPGGRRFVFADPSGNRLAVWATK
jgi:predicted enzyme related to lactoylglutathione lyase